MGVPISNVTRRVVYAASGTGPYNFTFEILADTDVAVYRDDTLLTLTTNYTVTINANGTGFITLTAAPTGATQIAIVGNRSIQRMTDFVTGGDFFANTVNDEMDQQTIFAQQNAEGLQRALSAPQTDPTNINMVLPRAADRAGKTLNFDSNGNPIAGLAVVASATTNVATWLGTPTSANLRAAMTDETGSGALVFGTSPTLSGPVISDGTANGVPYLNGSKVLTSGSALVFDGSNLGLGVTPSAWDGTAKVLQFEVGSITSSNGLGTALNLNAYYNGGWKYQTSGAVAMLYSQVGTGHAWLTAPSGTAGNTISFTQAMTLDSSNNLLVGTTTNTNTSKLNVVQTTASGYTTAVEALDNGGTFYLTAFRTANTIRGAITSNGTGVTYGSNSDYRLKEAVEPMQGALARNALLNPVKYKWKIDGSEGEGFIAHELQGPFPGAVTGTKDAVDADGNPIYQGIGTGPLDGHFAACINELTVKLEAALARIESLESK